MRAPIVPTVLPPGLRLKLRHGQARQLLGSPLGERLAARPVQARTSGAKVLLALGLTLGGAGLLIAALQAQPLLAAGALGWSLLAGLGYGLWRRRQGGMDLAALPRSGFEPQAVAALDKVLEAIATELPAAQLRQLVALKDSLARIAPALGQTSVGADFTQNDQHYLGELVRRYLPDTLQAFLQVPPAQRALADAQGQSAASLLGDQLTLLQGELDQREARLALAAREALAQQQRFLQAKAQER